MANNNSEKRGLASRMLDSMFPARVEQRNTEEVLQRKVEALYQEFFRGFLRHAFHTPDLLYQDDLVVLSQFWKMEVKPDAEGIAGNPIVLKPATYKKVIFGKQMERSRNRSDFFRNVKVNELTTEENISIKEAFLSLGRVIPSFSAATFSLESNEPEPLSFRFAASRRQDIYQMFLLFIPSESIDCSQEEIEEFIKTNYFDYKSIVKHNERNSWASELRGTALEFAWVQTMTGQNGKNYQVYYASKKSSYDDDINTKHKKKKKTRSPQPAQPQDLIPIIQT